LNLAGTALNLPVIPFIPMSPLLPLFIALLAIMLPGAASGAAGVRPNIVFVYTDDQGAWTLGSSGNRQTHTPHADRLATEGVIFRNAFVTTPVCSPARATVMTGRYASETGIYDYLGPKLDGENGLDLERFPVWPALLRDAGYRVGLFGKWHLGLQERHHPRRAGFDTFYGFRGGGTKPMDAELEVDGVDRVEPGYLEDRLFDAAIAFIRQNRATPFVAAVHTRAPHRAWKPIPPEDAAHFAGRTLAIPEPDYPGLDVERVHREMGEYLASVASVDRNLGRLLEALDTLGLARNTVVIFTSDHGYSLGHHGIWGKGNGLYMLREQPPATANIGAGVRPNMWDNSLRVPLVIRWPGVAAAGAKVDRTVTNLDWFPTLLAMAGVAAPPDSRRVGRNFVPLLRGESPAQWEDAYYGEYSIRHNSRGHMRMYRTPEWKLVRDFLDPTRDELYHLAADPGETNNLIRSTDRQAIAARDRLHTEIRRWMTQLGDTVAIGGK